MIYIVGRLPNSLNFWVRWFLTWYQSEVIHCVKAQWPHVRGRVETINRTLEKRILPKQYIRNKQEQAFHLHEKPFKIETDSTALSFQQTKHTFRFFTIVLLTLNRRLGWDPKQGESHLDSMLRGEILTALALFGHYVTINEASRRFNAFLDDRNTPLLPPDLRRVCIYKLILLYIPYRFLRCVLTDLFALPNRQHMLL